MGAKTLGIQPAMMPPISPMLIDASLRPKMNPRCDSSSVVAVNSGMMAVIANAAQHPLRNCVTIIQNTDGAYSCHVNVAAKNSMAIANDRRDPYRSIKIPTGTPTINPATRIVVDKIPASSLPKPRLTRKKLNNTSKKLIPNPNNTACRSTNQAARGTLRIDCIDIR